MPEQHDVGPSIALANDNDDDFSLDEVIGYNEDEIEEEEEEEEKDEGFIPDGSSSDTDIDGDFDTNLEANNVSTPVVMASPTTSLNLNQHLPQQIGK